MENLNKRLTYSDEDLKILRKTIEKVKNLNWNSDNKVNKSKKKEKNTLQKRAA